MKTLKACKLFFAGISFIFSHTLYGQISGTPYIFDKQPILITWLSYNKWPTNNFSYWPYRAVCYTAAWQSPGSAPLGHVDTNGDFVIDIPGRYLVTHFHSHLQGLYNHLKCGVSWDNCATFTVIDFGMIYTLPTGTRMYSYNEEPVDRWFTGAVSKDDIYKNLIIWRYLGP